MRTIQNNQLNSILLVKSGEDLSDIQNAVLRQLGSDTEVIVPISVDSEDCFTATLHLTLTENQFANASYLMKIVNSLSETIFTLTVDIEGNDDETRAYIIIDE